MPLYKKMLRITKKYLHKRTEEENQLAEKYDGTLTWKDIKIPNSRKNGLSYGFDIAYLYQIFKFLKNFDTTCTLYEYTSADRYGQKYEFQACNADIRIILMPVILND